MRKGAKDDASGRNANCAEPPNGKQQIDFPQNALHWLQHDREDQNDDATNNAQDSANIDVAAVVNAKNGTIVVKGCGYGIADADENKAKLENC